MLLQNYNFLASKNSDFLLMFAGLPSSMSRVGSAIWYLKNTTFYFFCYYATFPQKLFPSFSCPFSVASFLVLSDFKEWTANFFKDAVKALSLFVYFYLRMN